MSISYALAELFTDVKETEAIATSVADSDGVYFVPSFSGLQVCLFIDIIPHGVAFMQAFSRNLHIHKCIRINNVFIQFTI